MRRSFVKWSQQLSKLHSSSYKFNRSYISYDSQYYQPKSTSSTMCLGFLCGLVLTEDLNRKRRKGYCSEEVKEQKEPQKVTDLLTREEKLELVRELRIHEIGTPKDFPEGKLVEITVKHEGADYTIVAARVEGKIYAVGAYDTHDDESRLAEGVLFGDKLYSPNNGCAYNIKTGTVEYGPAMDNLPIFATGERNGKVYVWIPAVPPKKVKPMTCYRDFNDVRKVVVIGSGVAAFTCIETLREQGYSGDIKMISKDLHLPYDKTKLTKQFKNLDYKKLYLQEEEFYEDHGIDFQLGLEAINIVNRHGGPYVDLDNEEKVEYDALLIATGTNPENREIPGSKDANNCFYLEGIDDHKAISRKLETAKTVSLLGVNLRSLEVASTLRKEYPTLEVNIIDENETLSIEDKFGDEVTKALIKLYEKNGVKFILEEEINSFQQNDSNQVNQIEFRNGQKLKTDMVIYFPNNYLGNTEWLTEGENIENLEFDQFGKVKTDYHQRSDHKRIFAAGDCSSAIFFSNGQRLSCDDWYVAHHQGICAAMNMLALKIPFATIPFLQMKHFDKGLRYTGFTTLYNEVFVDGSVENWDFIAYYSANDTIMAAIGTDSRRKDITVITEALRLQMMPDLSDIKNRYENIRTIEKSIRNSKRSGCFKDLITEVNDKPYPTEVLWINRLPQSDEFYNFFTQGKQPAGPNEDTSDND